MMMQFGKAAGAESFLVPLCWGVQSHCSCSGDRITC